MSKQQRKLFSVLSVSLYGTALLLGIALGILISVTGQGKFVSLDTSKDDVTLYRELANKLKSVGLIQEAIAYYEHYYATARLDKRSKANLAYTIGTLYLDNNNYEKALSWLYQVEMLDPDTSLKSEVSAKIVHCLESSGRFHAAEYALGARSGRQKIPEADLKGSKVVAEVSGKKITLRELDEALEQLPPWIKDQFKGREKKFEFLKKFVADELCYRKAQKLELDKDSTIRQKTEQFMKQLLINKILEREIKEKITIVEDDVKNYFKANQERYKEKAQAKVRLIKAGSKEIAQNIVKELEKGKDFTELAKQLSLDKATAEKGGAWDGWVTEGNDDLGIGNVEEVSKAIFSTTPGTLSPIVKAGDYYYLFKVEDKKPERTRGYQEVEEWVKNDYLTNKMTIAYHNLIEQLINSAEVKLYPQTIMEETTGK